MNNFAISEDSKLIMSINDDKEVLFNDKSYKFLNKKRAQFNSRLEFITETEKEKNDLIFYYSLNPMKLVKNPNMKFKISKDDLNKFFIESREKKENKENKEIYYTKLYELINPYHLIQEKKYINKKYISQENLKILEQEKEVLIERENNKYKNKYYDKNKRISFELPKNQREFNYIKNGELIKKCIDQKCLVVKLTNLFDDFSEILLLQPNFGLEELIVLIRFLYKTKYDQNNIKSLNLYNQEDLKDKIDLEKIKTLKDLYEKLKPKTYELSIFIDAQY